MCELDPQHAAVWRNEPPVEESFDLGRHPVQNACPDPVRYQNVMYSGHVARVHDVLVADGVRARVLDGMPTEVK